MKINFELNESKHSISGVLGIDIKDFTERMKYICAKSILENKTTTTKEFVENILKYLNVQELVLLGLFYINRIIEDTEGAVMEEQDLEEPSKPTKLPDFSLVLDKNEKSSNIAGLYDIPLDIEKIYNTFKATINEFPEKNLLIQCSYALDKMPVKFMYANVLADMYKQIKVEK